MRLYSTNRNSPDVDLREAVLRGLPPDNGLYMPYFLEQLPDEVLNNLHSYSIDEIGFEVCKHLFQGYIPLDDLKGIIQRAISFPAPLEKLENQTYVLELFHGPSLAFKDFGARFMAELMSYFNKGEDRELLILVATSGDTGGAVASGFVGVPGIKVCILYPSGKVSPLQEKQLTTHGRNITAIEIDGTFDDCQRLVKSAFLDGELQQQLRLSSANSINIARLIPQSFYYFEAFRQLPKGTSEAIFSVPSGNFGNLTAGIFAKRMGLPIKQFIAATNSNAIVPEFLETGEYLPKPSVRTISNAMDVGDPSNFRRLDDLFCSTWNIFREEVVGFSYSDAETKRQMQETYANLGYILDPHGAVGLLALKEYQSINGLGVPGVVLETAHPAKFLEDVEEILSINVVLPDSLSRLKNLEKEAHSLSIEFPSFKEFLLNTF